jgi:S-methylmethionine-dependent homocysteine/selenocysteine methylase
MQTLLPPDGRLYVTDGGIETTLIYHGGHELPDFAAFDLLRRPGGREALQCYFLAYDDIARRHGAGLVLESATWRASADWGARLGYSRRELADANREAVRLLQDIKASRAPLNGAGPTLVSGCIGPRGDGYQPAATMSEVEARRYHRDQVEALAAAGVDLVTAITMNYTEEAVGIAVAAREAGVPAVISFTVETDGRLPTGEPLREAIERVDGATFGHPAYYMLNCAHPEHFEGALARREAWTARIRGLRANASRKSHAELNEATALDIGDPSELGRQYADIKRRLLPGLAVVGGCCGTDHRHVESMAAACAPLFAGGA